MRILNKIYLVSVTHKKKTDKKLNINIFFMYINIYSCIFIFQTWNRQIDKFVKLKKYPNNIFILIKILKSKSTKFKTDY